jgi:hypothetical protein
MKAISRGSLIISNCRFINFERGLYEKILCPAILSCIDDVDPECFPDYRMH